MRPTTVGAIADAVGGAVREGADTAIGSVATDSRAVRPDGIFVALTGERLDGHDYVADALERGAAAVLVRAGFPVDAPAVHVRDTGDALLDLGAAERRAFGGTVVAITGANGKTSTKDLAGGVVGAHRRTHVSPSSFNNEVGLPMTLLGAPPDTEVVVAELGARHVGDVTRLCAVARPHMAVVTNVGVAHLEVFGSWEAIVEASAEPVDALPADGVAILSADDPVVAGYAARSPARVVTFGRAPDADVRAGDVTLDRDGTASFELRHDDDRARVRLRVPGEHMVANALAAAAVGLELDVPLAEAAVALGEARITRWRMQTSGTVAGVRVVNDAYNANPESVAAALKTARWMAGGDGRLIAVLGQMAELGPIATAEHERVGELAARLPVDRLLAIGPDAKAIVVAAVREGVEPDAAIAYDDPDAALADVVSYTAPGDVVLVKGSRVTRLEVLGERLAEALA
jgi:UDP-N-acetylmuramoyl-tripeptide--D-alanyl-D-alanine ligase